MSWAIGDDREHDRFRGYGVPAYCDVKGCQTEIDRGLAYLCDGTTCDRPGEDGDDGVGCWDLDDMEKPLLFLCGEHTCADVDETDLPPEHPDWIRHLLADESWEQWRTENPDKVARLIATSEADPTPRVQAIEAAEDRADQVVFDAWRERGL